MYTIMCIVCGTVQHQWCPNAGIDTEVVKPWDLPPQNLAPPPQRKSFFKGPSTATHTRSINCYTPGGSQKMMQRPNPHLHRVIHTHAPKLVFCLIRVHCFSQDVFYLVFLEIDLVDCYKAAFPSCMAATIV